MQMLVDLEIVFLYDISEMPFANYTFSVFRVLRISSVGMCLRDTTVQVEQWPILHIHLLS